MRKLLISILSLFLLITASIGLFACNESSPTIEPIDETKLVDLFYQKTSSGYVVTGLKNKNAKNVVIPEGVVKIKEDAFINESIIESITLPSSLTSIEENAFRFCKNLNVVNFEGQSSLKSIGNFAFYGCKSLFNMTLPLSLKTLGEYVFTDCESIVIYCEYDSNNIPSTWSKSWNDAYQPIVWDSINNKVASDGKIYFAENGLKYAISGSNAVLVKQVSTASEFIVPRTVSYNGITYLVNEIGDSAFKDCINLLKIYIPSSITIMGDKLFENCKGIIVYLEGETSSAWPKTWNYFFIVNEGQPLLAPTICNYKNNDIALDKFVYVHVNDLKYKLDTANKVATIEFQALSTVRAIFVDTITYKNEEYTVTTSQSLALMNSTSLVECVLPTTLKTIGWRFLENCTSLTYLFVPKNVSTLGWYAFSGCSSLETLEFEKGSKITTITQGAIACSSLTKLILPDQLQTIVSNSISCENLKELVLPATLTTIQKGGLKGTGRAYLYLLHTEYPQGWETTSFWKDALNDNGNDNGRALYSETKKVDPNGAQYYWYYDNNGNPKVWMNY